MEPWIVALLQEIADCAYNNGDVTEWPESAVDRLQHIGERAQFALEDVGYELAPPKANDDHEDDAA